MDDMMGTYLYFECPLSTSSKRLKACPYATKSSSETREVRFSISPETYSSVGGVSMLASA